jgi:hypothetical protein
VELRVAVGWSGDVGVGGEPEVMALVWETDDCVRLWRQNKRRAEEGETGLGGLGFTRTVFAPVQALRRASKHARPGFHFISSRTALLRRARFVSTESRTAAPTASGLSNRKGEAGGWGPSLSERSEVHSARGWKCTGSSEMVLYTDSVSDSESASSPGSLGAASSAVGSAGAGGEATAGGHVNSQSLRTFSARYFLTASLFLALSLLTRSASTSEGGWAP